MLCEYSHAKSKSWAQIHATVAEIRNFFIWVCFLIGAPSIFSKVIIKVAPSGEN